MTNNFMETLSKDYEESYRKTIDFIMQLERESSITWEERNTMIKLLDEVTQKWYEHGCEFTKKLYGIEG